MGGKPRVDRGSLRLMGKLGTPAPVATVYVTRDQGLDHIAEMFLGASSSVEPERDPDGRWHHPNPDVITVRACRRYLERHDLWPSNYTTVVQASALLMVSSSDSGDDDQHPHHYEVKLR